jgi:hypothetical protein
MSKPTIEMYWNDSGHAIYKNGTPYLLYRPEKTCFTNFIQSLSENFPEGFNFVDKGEVDDFIIDRDFC